MENNEKVLSLESEKTILARQNIAAVIVAILIILLVIAQFLDLGTAVRYLFLASPVLLIYIGVSSIKNRLSIFHFSGIGGVSRGKSAVTNGIFAILTAVVYFLFFGIAPLVELFSRRF